MKTQPNTQAKAEYGRLGGLARSEAKAAAARKNGRKGGRPRKYERPTPPSFAYPGGKSKMVGILLPYIPRSGGIYCEPFAGRGNLFWSVAGVVDYKRWWLNDLQTAAFFDAIREHGHELMVPPRTRSQYYSRWADFKQNECPFARLLEPYLTFAGGGYGMGGFCTSAHGAVTRSGYQQSVRMAHDILRVTQPLITAHDYREILAGLSEDDFAYLDPPYKDSDVRAYNNNTIDHAELVDTLLCAKYRWMLSEYEHPVYNRLGKPILRKTVQLRLNTAVQNTRTECVWTNYLSTAS